MATNELHTEAEKWIPLFIELCLLGTKDADDITESSLPDKHYDDILRQLTEGASVVADRMRELANLPEEKRRATLGIDRNDPVSEVTQHMENALNDWYWETGNRVRDSSDVWEGIRVLQEAKPDITIPEVLEDEGCFELREEVVNIVLTEPFRSAFAEYPLGAFAGGLHRLLRDFELAVIDVATRPMNQTEIRLFELLDQNRRRAWLAWRESWAFADGLSETVDRYMALIAMATRGPRRLGPYREMLIRCYTNHLDPECLIVCRSLLEDTIRDAFRRNGLGDQIPDNLKKKIRFARMSGWITDDERRQADAIRIRANKAVHEGQTDLVRDVEGTIADTLGILQSLG